MAHYLIHLRGYYLTWSSILDAPNGVGMLEAECYEHLMIRYGIDQPYTFQLMAESQRGYPMLIRNYSNLSYTARHAAPNEEFMELNRAGFHEGYLTLDEIYQIYCVENRLPREEDAQD